MLQKGVGQGTVTRRRRNPRERVEDVAVTEASGLTLGSDGYPHPLETSADGKLQVQARDLKSILEEILMYQRATVLGLSLLTNTDLLDEV